MLNQKKKTTFFQLKILKSPKKINKTVFAVNVDVDILDNCATNSTKYIMKVEHIFLSEIK